MVHEFTSQSGNRFFVMNDKVYISYLKSRQPNKIHKEVPLQGFNFEPLTPAQSDGVITGEMFSMIGEFQGEQEAKRLYLENQAKKAYKKRREDILNLWNWRKGKNTAYVVTTHEAENSDRCVDHVNHEEEIFFSKEEAEDYYDACSTTTPSEWGYYFVTRLYELNAVNIKVEEDENPVLEVMSLEELIDLTLTHTEEVKSANYAEPLPEDIIIVTLENRGGGRGHKFISAERRRKWSGWIGSVYYSSQDTYADLQPWEDRSFTRYQVAMDEADVIEQYGDVDIQG